MSVDGSAANASPIKTALKYSTPALLEDYQINPLSQPFIRPGVEKLAPFPCSPPIKITIAPPKYQSEEERAWLKQREATAAAFTRTEIKQPEQQTSDRSESG